MDQTFNIVTIPLISMDSYQIVLEKHVFGKGCMGCNRIVGYVIERCLSNNKQVVKDYLIHFVAKYFSLWKQPLLHSACC